jgi:hypothetical protein
MDTYWLCDTCGGKINSPGEGLVEWYSFNDDEGVLKHSNFRLVHEESVSPLKRLKLKRKGCEFDLYRGEFRAKGTIENRPLAEFLGADGLMRLLSLISDGNFPVAEIVRMIRRLHVPGYEMAKDFFGAAASDGIIREGTPDAYHDQEDINAVLQWLKAKRG